MIRSYQRIFRPERRLYQLEGKQLPVPGGVPLRWLGWAAGTLLAVLALSAGSWAVALAAALAAGVAGLAASGRWLGIVCCALGLIAAPGVGVVLRLFDWPLRLVVLPALVATLATQATPDGRRADRFAWSWLLTRLSARRRSLGRALPEAHRPYVVGAEIWVAACAGPVLRRGRVRGPALVSFGVPVVLRRGRIRRRRLVARTPGPRFRPRDTAAAVVELGAAERLEVRP
ncbi:MAG: hypothetical protein QOD71_451 [Thermoleophilaceae bacterium]|nr:hypothetical protein [Thermoleophilaceae bacterium]